MILCLNCKRLNSAGSIHCQGCSGTFGRRLCKKKHVAAMNADFCPICGVGSDKLSTPVHYVPLGCVTWLVAWGVAAVALWSGWRLGAPLVQSHLPGTLSSQTLACLVQQLLAWAIGLAVLWLVLVVMLPSEVTKALGKMLKAAGKLVSLFFSGIVALLRVTLATVGFLFRLVGGPRAPPT
jgi:hypothetical protein